MDLFKPLKYGSRRGRSTPKDHPFRIEQNEIFKRRKGRKPHHSDYYTTDNFYKYITKKEQAGRRIHDDDNFIMRLINQIKSFGCISPGVGGEEREQSGQHIPGQLDPDEDGISK